jgi:DNA polymerase-3 subunit epsilon
LCSRYQIDNSQRDLHGALLDAQILLDVYLAMTGGQGNLSLEDEQTRHDGQVIHRLLVRDRGELRTIAPTTEELQAHQQRLEAINKDSGGKCIWLK